MIRARGLATILALCSFAVASAQAQQLGASVQSATYDSAKNEIIVQLYNSSRQDVTAYNFSLRIDYADGTTRVEDRGAEVPSEETDPRLVFLAGTTREEKFPQPLPNKKVTRVVAVVDMVVYADNTAEVINEAAFRRLVESRKARVVGTQKVNELLKQALSAENPGQAALAELQSLLKVYEAKERPDAQDADMEFALHSAIANLTIRHDGRPPTLERLQEYIKYHDQELAKLKRHQDIRRLQ
jgi:hypothetical protein